MVVKLTWENTKGTLKVGELVHGIVHRHEPFGVFVEIPGISFPGLVQITDFKDQGRMTVGEYPPVGTEIEARILGFKEAGQQIWLGMKPSQLAQKQGNLHEHGFNVGGNQDVADR